MRKITFKEIKLLAQGQTSSKSQSLDSNHLTSKSLLLTAYKTAELYLGNVEDLECQTKVMKLNSCSLMYIIII